MAIARTTGVLWAGNLKIRRKEEKTRGGSRGEKQETMDVPLEEGTAMEKGRLPREDSSRDPIHKSTDVRPFSVTLRVREDIPDLLPAHKNTQRLNHQKLLSLTKTKHPQLHIRKTQKKTDGTQVRKF